MKLIFLNVLAISVVAAPQFVVSAIRSRSRWLDENYDWFCVVVWAASLLGLYVFILPLLGLRPNHEFFRWTS